MLHLISFHLKGNQVDLLEEWELQRIILRDGSAGRVKVGINYFTHVLQREAGYAKSILYTLYNMGTHIKIESVSSQKLHVLEKN